MSIINKLLPVIPESGFEMPGYSIWGSTLIKDENGTYCMFASRCDDFFVNHMANAEIVLATTDDLNKPFEFEQVIISHRDAEFWDGEAAFNPSIIRHKDKFVLFYCGRNGKIGYALSDSAHGPFVRSEKPLDIPFPAYNPSAIVDRDGLIHLFVRDEKKKVYLFEATSPDGKFSILRRDIFPLGEIEDMNVFEVKFGYNMIALDTEGMYGGLRDAGSIFRSADGLYWHPASPALAYSFTFEMDNGSGLTVERREHPHIFIDETGNYLFTAVQFGERVWNIVQRITD